MASVYEVLINRLKIFFQKPLPCTGKTSPIAILADKGTIKRDVTQPTLIRVTSPKIQSLFRKFYLSHPEVTSHMVIMWLSYCCFQLKKPWDHRWNPESILRRCIWWSIFTIKRGRLSFQKFIPRSNFHKGFCNLGCCTSFWITMRNSKLHGCKS